MAERRIAGGTIRVEHQDGLVRARGVRYGTARRFAVAEAPPAWSGVRDATQSGPACPQRPSRLGWVTGDVLEGLSMDENCLVLTVTAPADARRLPVMVWFHGGAYVAGSGESAKYDAGALARTGNVVVVNVSYRLGIFGYLAPPGTGEDNLGLRDQILALRWVRDNIAAFGGDAANVTAFGQSAGAHSVMSLMLCEDAAGLFHRAILQSAPLELDAGRDDMARDMLAAMATSLGGADPAEATADRLLAAEAAAVAAAQGFGLLGGLAFSPRLGRKPLPAPADVPGAVAEAAGRIELLIGYTKDDGAPFVAMDARAARLNRVPALGRLAVRAGSASITKKAFAGPAERLAEAWRTHGGRVGTYRFDWTPDGAPLGACHCMELPFLFGSPQTWADAPMLGPGRAIDTQLSAEMRTRWAQFAHHGVDSLPAPSLRFG
ncbi:carboxylesterase family protein [Mycolicibacterium neworleansense]|uniref:Para-nitrobenzyl esterase n=1 Tax=Mycolicibacterium neworleansense TaxID=146018 RepID=A0A0H5RVW9_9MYCO|nr:carboxylesterase family protein [Mycolicibacterium neworleansense]MCV7360716.1 carboxylesterase family protein [Mycolicibacterium neworleansense]CRZ17667.1 para-nitrobenzyl esterase [Mycolicibacterium neworleansense]